MGRGFYADRSEKKKRWLLLMEGKRRDLMGLYRPKSSLDDWSRAPLVLCVELKPELVDTIINFNDNEYLFLVHSLSG